ncbi:hypothetical protein KGF54_004784 [Candida jiufengensis]|uniref:uncharacterized protein n=1 Tax=Candida jiufengensis TaxID=497108 RepID=UPI002224E6ED|nr:uncharacterized protein KGF54_004784 [Candida jiufengensis]KAI5951709.1 hypothetical protein KGF54_004784 [Candida jiufengensis]
MKYTKFLVKICILCLLPSISAQFYQAQNFNISDVERRFHAHINFIKEHLPHENLFRVNEIRPLVLISNEGVPLNYNSISTTNEEFTHYGQFNVSFGITKKRIVNKAQLITAMQIPRPIEEVLGEKHMELVTDITQSKTAEFSTTIPEFKFTHTFPNLIPMETFTAATTTLNKFQKYQARIKDFDAVAEIKRLESLLVSLKNQMYQQQVYFKKQLQEFQATHVKQNELASKLKKSMSDLSIIKTFDITTPTPSPVMKLATADKFLNPDEFEYELSSSNKINGKKVMGQKNPPNSVIFEPQFQQHQKVKHTNKLKYFKPKLAWNDIFTFSTSVSTSSTSSTSISILSTSPPTSTSHDNYQENLINENFDRDSLLSQASLPDESNYDIIQDENENENQVEYILNSVEEPFYRGDPYYDGLMLGEPGEDSFQYNLEDKANLNASKTTPTIDKGVAKPIPEIILNPQEEKEKSITATTVQNNYVDDERHNTNEKLISHNFDENIHDVGGMKDIYNKDYSPKFIVEDRLLKIEEKSSNENIPFQDQRQIEQLKEFYNDEYFNQPLYPTKIDQNDKSDIVNQNDQMARPENSTASNLIDEAILKNARRRKKTPGIEQMNRLPHKTYNFDVFDFEKFSRNNFEVIKVNRVIVYIALVFFFFI